MIEHLPKNKAYMAPHAHSLWTIYDARPACSPDHGFQTKTSSLRLRLSAVTEQCQRHANFILRGGVLSYAPQLAYFFCLFCLPFLSLPFFSISSSSNERKGQLSRDSLWLESQLVLSKGPNLVSRVCGWRFYRIDYRRL